MVITMEGIHVLEEVIRMAVFTIVLQTAGLINITECQEEALPTHHIAIPGQRAFLQIILQGQVVVTVQARYIQEGQENLTHLQEMKMYRAAEGLIIVQDHPGHILQAIVSQEPTADLHIMNRVQAHPAQRVLQGLKVLR
jgi:hypothetical protein